MYIFDIIIALLDKILPWGIKKFIPLIKVSPKKIVFNKSEWQEKTNFFVYNRSNDTLFEIYVCLDLKNLKSENFEIEKINIKDYDKENLGNIVINYEVVRLNCEYEDNKKNFILLKISQVENNSMAIFSIKTNEDGEVYFKVLKYSKIPAKILKQENKFAITFEIPMKNKRRKITLKGVSMLLKKAN